MHLRLLGFKARSRRQRLPLTADVSCFGYGLTQHCWTRVACDALH
jgi:hypothetical protein